jgi:hypothetical protein
MWNSVGLWREAALLQTAVEALDEWYGALGTDRGRIAALVTVGRPDGPCRAPPGGKRAAATREPTFRPEMT